MRNCVFIFLFAACLFTAKAQLLNASFEQSDSLNTVSGWNLVQGKLSRYSVINFGLIPFTAANGNYFILLESDTDALPAKRALLEQQFTLNDTPGNVSLNYLYIPENTSQHAEITLFFSKWNGTQRDTVLYKKDTISVVANGNDIPIQWNTYSARLKGSYRNLLPDTAWIRLSNLDNTMPGKNVKLFADNIILSQWPVGLAEQTGNMVKIFPNPVADLLTVSLTGAQQPDQFLLTDITGKQFAVTDYSFSADHHCSVSVREIPNGLYSLLLMAGNAQLHRQLILIKH